MRHESGKEIEIMGMVLSHTGIIYYVNMRSGIVKWGYDLKIKPYQPFQKRGIHEYIDFGDDGESLYVYSSSGLKKGLSNVAEEVGVSVGLKHKKINVSNSRVAWEHEQFSRLRVTAATLSGLSAPPELLESTGGAKVAVLVESPGGKVYMLGEDLIDDCYGNDVVETGQLEMKKDAVDELKMNSNIPEKLGSEEMKKNLVMEDDNDSMIINNTQAVLDSDEIKKNLVVEDDNDSMIINNTQAVLDSDEIKKNLVVEDDNESMIINNTQAVLDSNEMKKNVVNEANDLMTIPMLDSDLSLDMSWSDSDTFDVSWLDSYRSWINNYPKHGDTHTFDMNFHHGVQV
nr:nicalin isoform X1 [Tanacetum cinerariifolium]